MKLSNFVNYILGYTVFEIRSAYGERFISACAADNLELRGIRRIDQAAIEAKVFLFDYKRAENIARKTHTELKIIKKVGIPVVISKYRLRYGIPVGIILFFALLFFLTSLIWRIDVVGNYSIRSEQISEFLESKGFKTGTFSFTHDLKSLKLSLMQEFDLAFASIHLKGSKVTVEITEMRVPPDRIPTHIPCNIIAASDAQIIQIDTLEGVPYVKNGQAVRAGQLLVGGIFNSKIVGYRLVHAAAVVKARTRKIFSEEISFEQTEYEKTGNSFGYYALKILDFTINFKLPGRIRYEKYDIIKETEEISVFGLMLPLEIQKIKCDELKEKHYFITEEEAISRAEKILNEIERVSLVKCEIEEKNIEYTLNPDSLKCEYIFTVIEDIALSSEIIIEKED